MNVNEFGGKINSKQNYLKKFFENKRIKDYFEFQLRFRSFTKSLHQELTIGSSEKISE